MTRTGVAARPAFEDRAESLFDSARIHWRKAAIAAVGVVAIAGSIVLYNRSQAIRAERAEQALFEAQRSLTSGNAALAQTDLQRMVTRYEGTGAAVYGTFLLAQLLYDQGKAAEGLRLLQEIEGSGAARDIRPSIYALMATGYQQQGKPADAAAQYQRAAASATFELDQTNYKADAARAYMAAGNRQAARELWTELSEDPSSSLAGEARVRLGELMAAPATKS